MVRTDIRNPARNAGEIAEKIELRGWHKLTHREQFLCEKHIQDVLQYLGAEKKKLVAAIHDVTPEARPRLHIGKSYLMETHRRKIRLRRRKLGRQLTRMTPTQVDRFLALP